MQGFARAYTNIALIKYWGKKDAVEMIPMNNSISLTLDAFYTETFVLFDPALKEDVLILNGKKQKDASKVTKLLDYARKLKGISTFATVTSTNHVPTAAGLASSASGMAALAGSVAEALDLTTDKTFLSRLARHGSGSACRSIYGGFAEWEKGVDDQTSLAIPLKEDLSNWPLAMVFILINQKEKEVSSREGMERTVKTSVFYDGWLNSIDEDLKKARLAIETQDFELLGQTMEANALKMHACCLGATPPFTYFAPETILGMEVIRKIRKKGISCYFTMDAGPNIKVLVKKENVENLLNELKKTFSTEQLVVAFPGEGIVTKKEF